MRETIVALLQADATLGSYLPGGIFDAYEVAEISRQTTPGAFDDNSELQASAIVLVRGPVSVADTYTHGARQTIEVFLYNAPSEARERIYDLLHDTRPQPSGSSASAWRIEHADDIPGQEDPALRATLSVSRYTALIRRR